LIKKKERIKESEKDIKVNRRQSDGEKNQKDSE